MCSSGRTDSGEGDPALLVRLRPVWGLRRLHRTPGRLAKQLVRARDSWGELAVVAGTRAAWAGGVELTGVGNLLGEVRWGAEWFAAHLGGLYRCERVQANGWPDRRSGHARRSASASSAPSARRQACGRV